MVDSTYLIVGGYFHHSGGKPALARLLAIQLAKAGLGAEGLGAPFAAEEDDPLVKDAQAADLHRPGGAHEGVGGDPVEVADVHGVEAPVEAHGLHVDVNMQQLGAAGLDAHRPVDGALRALGGVQAEILDTVFVFAAVKDLLGVYAHGLPDAGALLHGTGHDLFRHCDTS